MNFAGLQKLASALRSAFHGGLGGGTPGQTITAPNDDGSTLTGGSGDDTLVASHGPDVLTGGGGDDAFTFNVLPWSAGHVTDFKPGADQLDLSALFAQAGYHGTDPVADGYLSFSDDGAGGTRVWLDTDGPGSANPWPFLITTLDHTAPSAINVARDVIISDSDTGSSSGGGHGWTGGDMFLSHFLSAIGSRFADQLPALKQLDLGHLFQRIGYHGANPVAEGYVKFTADSVGGTKVWFDADGSAGAGAPHLLGDFQHLSFSAVQGHDWLFG